MIKDLGNNMDHYLFPNSTALKVILIRIDITSNGFKLRSIVLVKATILTIYLHGLWQKH